MAQTRITPRVFISAASADLRGARIVVKHALLTLGCYPIVQEHFEPDYRSVKEMIRSRLASCHAMVHLVGRRYGGEPSPQTLPAGAPRRSWTQMEYDLAVELGLKTYLFVCADDYPFDSPDTPETPEETTLQEAHRQAILNGEQLYVEVANPNELANRVREMKLEAAELRKRVKKSREHLYLALGGIGAILAGVFFMLLILDRNDDELTRGQQQILSSVADMRLSFDRLSSDGGIIAKPSSPEQFYHNAQLYQLRGDYGNARQAYIDYFRHDTPFLDPHLRFQQFLKVQEGVAGARETYRDVTADSDGVVAKFASILLWDHEKRLSILELFLQAHPDFGPAHYLLSREFSPSRLGEQSLEDKRRERRLLESFQELDGEGKVVRWFLDKSLVAKWREEAAARLAVLAASLPAMEQPVAVTWTGHNAGWTGTIQIGEPATEIFLKLPGKPNFVSTGFSPAIDTATGKPRPQALVQLPRDVGAMSFEIKYANLRGHEMGPFQITFDPSAETFALDRQQLASTRHAWVSFRDYEGKTLLYFTHLLAHRGSLGAIRYGIDTAEPDREFAFPPYEKPGLAPIPSDPLPYLEVPPDTGFVSIRLEFKDGSQSDVVRFDRPQ